MSRGIVIPLILLPIFVIGAFVWYRRSIARLRPAEAKPVSGLRLTAEALHRAPTPPWRVVYEIGGALGGIDHVIVGRCGVTAITTIVADRPDPDALRNTRGEAILVSEAAIARGPLDELLRAANAKCDRWARVHWGRPDVKRPVEEPLVHASVLVEGQRIEEWLTGLDAAATDPLDPDRVDVIWRTIVTGIGRPEPLP